MELFYQLILCEIYDCTLLDCFIILCGKKEEKSITKGKKLVCSFFFRRFV